MKKIKIITFQNAHNYGALLQAFALQNKLSESNDVEVINYDNLVIGKIYKIINVHTDNLVKFIKSMVKSFGLYIPNKIRYKNFKDFQTKKIKLTQEVYHTEEDFINRSPEADVYITGSDQVWNSQITEGLQDSYTLNFGKENVNRISYAASIGKSSISKDEEDIYIKKISSIKHISVREETAKKALSELIENPIETVLDPTLLLTKDEWEENIKDIKKEKEKYILAYVVEPDEEYIKIANELSENKKIKIIHFSLRKRGLKNILKCAYTVGPLEFVSLIKNAEYVICTSFHATVFSIIFNKKFFVIPHRKTGSRVTDLLKKLNIDNRAINTIEQFKKVDYDQEIDYENVNKILEKEREKSLNWLNNAINN